MSNYFSSNAPSLWEEKPIQSVGVHFFSLLCFTLIGLFKAGCCVFDMYYLQHEGNKLMMYSSKAEYGWSLNWEDEKSSWIKPYVFITSPFCIFTVNCSAPNIVNPHKTLYLMELPYNYSSFTPNYQHQQRFKKMISTAEETVLLRRYQIVNGQENTLISCHPHGKHS